MATKKNTTPGTSHKTHKGRQPKTAKIEDAATEASPPVGAVLAEAVEVPAEPPVAAEVAETPAAPKAESTTIVTATLVGEATTAEPPPAEAPPTYKLSALDAAAKVLGETDQAMTCAELIVAMAAKGYWNSPKGRTPSGTLYSAVLREIQTKGDQSRFRKTERGKFALRLTV